MKEFLKGWIQGNKKKKERKKEFSKRKVPENINIAIWSLKH